MGKEYFSRLISFTLEKSTLDRCFSLNTKVTQLTYMLHIRQAYGLRAMWYIHSLWWWRTRSWFRSSSLRLAQKKISKILVDKIKTGPTQRNYAQNPPPILHLLSFPINAGRTILFIIANLINHYNNIYYYWHYLKIKIIVSFLITSRNFLSSLNQRAVYIFPLTLENHSKSLGIC